MIKKNRTVSAVFRWIIGIWNNRKVISDLAYTDLETRYASSYLGIFWAYFQPIVTVVIYALVFGAGFRMRPNVGYPYVPWLVAGMIPWIFFQDTVLMNTTCLREYNYLVKKVVFDVKLLPIAKEMTAFLIHMVFLVLCVVIHSVCRVAVSPYYFQLPYYLFCGAMFSLGISYLVSSLSVFFPDLQQIVSIILQFGIWATPIMWHESLFGETVEKILKINPFYYVVSGYRDCLFGKVGFWEKPFLGLWFWGVTLFLLFIGMNTFRKLEGHFADVL